MIGADQHQVAVGRLAPPRTKHSLLGLKAFGDVALLGVSDGEEGQCLASGEVDKLGGVKALPLNAETLGMLLQLVVTTEHGLANIHHLIETAVVVQYVEQVL